MDSIINGICQECGSGKWVDTHEIICQSCAAMPAVQRAPWLDRVYADDSADILREEADYLTRAGMDSQERLDEWRQEYNEARELSGVNL